MSTDVTGVTGTVRILVIDDDPDFVAFYRDILAGDGLIVAAANTRDEAVEHLAAAGAAFDVVLLDRELRRESGLEVIPDIRRLAPLAAIILVTAYATSADIDRALKLGVHDHLLKSGPFEQSLLTKVRSAIAARSRLNGHRESGHERRG